MYEDNEKLSVEINSTSYKATGRPIDTDVSIDLEDELVRNIQQYRCIQLTPRDAMRLGQKLIDAGEKAREMNK